MKYPVYKIFWMLTIITIGILVIHSSMVLSKHYTNISLPDFLVGRFDIDGEANLPAWYSTVLLFSVSTTAFLLYCLDNKFSEYNPLRRSFWLGFGIVYILLSLDEGAQMHEIIDKLTDIKWVLIYAPLVGFFLLLCLYYFVVIRRDDSALRNWVIGGLVVYATGGLGCEWINHTFRLADAFLQIEYVAEEGLEMIGTAMVLTGSLRELNNQFNKYFSIKKASSDNVTE